MTTIPRMIYGHATVEMVEYRDRVPAASIVGDHDCEGLVWARMEVIEFMPLRSDKYIYTLKSGAGSVVCNGNWRNFQRDAVQPANASK